VKCAIALKIALQNDEFTKLVFELWGWNWSDSSRTQRIGRAEKVATFDFSNENKPPNKTTYAFPSYFFFPDGVYPLSFPPHPTPPRKRDHLDYSDFSSNRIPSLQELKVLNNEIDLENSQRSPVTVDFADISSKIRKLCV